MYLGEREKVRREEVEKSEKFRERERESEGTREDVMKR